MAPPNNGSVLGPRTYPKLEALKKSGDVKPILDKVVAPREMTQRWGGKNRELTPSGALLQTVSNMTTQNIGDANNILQLIPDTELAIQILVASILSPKDMVTTELGYRVDSAILPGDVSAPLLEVVKTYFDETYKIKSYLPKILEDILFRKGSYPLLVLPETSIDAVINSQGAVSMESLRDDIDHKGQPIASVGILGSPTKATNQWSLESMLSGQTHTVAEDDLFVKGVPQRIGKSVRVTDNPNIVKFPRLVDKMRRDRLENVLSYRGMSLEGRKDKPSEDDVRGSVMRHRTYQPTPMITLPTQDQTGRQTVGHPLVIKLPPEAVIPVHVPSNPEDHIGYFVLLDQHGNPLNRVREADYYRDLSTNLSNTQNQDFSSQLLSQAQFSAQGSQGMNGGNRKLEVEEAVRLYSEIIEKDLINRLKNGVYGDGVEVARPQEVYRVMLARSLAQKQTQLLYLPVEMLSYMAFDYNQYGIGKTLLEDNKILAGIRAMLLFSNTMAAIKNSVGRTGLKIQLDPEDPDPSTTVEFLIHEYAKNRQAGYPLGASNPLDIINFLQNAAIDVNVSGNTAYPETTMDVEDKASSKTPVDTELEEKIRDRYFMSLGISPETIDLSKNVEFATSVVSSNLLLAKRVIVYQDKLTTHLQDFLQKYTLNSGYLMQRLRETLEANKSAIPSDQRDNLEQVLMNFLYSLEVHLPRPDTVTLENQMEAFRNYGEALTMALDAYFSEDMMEMTELDDVDQDVRGVRAAIEAHFKREWLRNNNVLPELVDLITVDEKDQAMLDLLETHGNHLKAIGKGIAKFMDKLRKARQKREAKYGENAEGDTDDTGSTDDDGGYGDDFGMGGDDDDDFGGDDPDAEGGGDDAEEETDDPDAESEEEPDDNAEEESEEEEETDSDDDADDDDKKDD